MTREAWLEELGRLMAPRFRELGHPLPPAWRVSIGFPYGSRGHSIGECWAPHTAADQAPQIHIAPTLSDDMTFAGVLAHELAHAALGHEAGHGPHFRAFVRALGLVGPATATTVGDAFRLWVQPLLSQMGPLPHARLSPGCAAIGAPKKQSARMRKVTCPACGYTLRTTQKWLDIAVPLCPDDGCDRARQEMDVEDE